MLNQLDGLAAGVRALRCPGIIGPKQQHQGCCKLLSAAPGALGLQGVPIPVTYCEMSLQSDSHL
ncbi:hypothetical protein KQ298_06980 [Synechococcus sp. CS-1330]|nr:hypothetical protein [Synechococcus sp. CS-1330]